MGGFAVPIGENLPEHDHFVPPSSRRTWFVSKVGVPFLEEVFGADKQDIHNLKLEEIEAKSKANGLAKALVCFQALWFIATCVTRRTYFDRHSSITSDLCRSCTAYTQQLVRAEHVWSRGLRVVHLPSLVGEAFRGRVSHHNSESNCPGCLCIGLDVDLSIVINPEC